jgi:hypothetical protein
MVVILFETKLTAGSLFVLAVVCCTEMSYFFTVLAFIHFNYLNYTH